MHHGALWEVFPEVARTAPSAGPAAFPGQRLVRESLRLAFCLLPWIPCSATAATWTNVLGGTWNEASNWSDHLVPAGTNASIGLPGGYVVTIGADATVRELLLDNPTATLGGAGALIVSEGFAWRRGTLGGPATALLVAQGNLLLTAATAGTTRSLARTLINAGSATWDDPATLLLGPSSTISNLAKATFVIAGTGNIDAGSGGGRFLNAGTLRKTGTSPTDFGAELRNSGTVRIESGTLGLRQGLQHSGSIQISNLAGLTLVGGTHNFLPGSTLAGAGGLTIAGGTVTLGGLVELNGPHLFRGGNVAVTGTFNALTNLLTVDGANVTFSGAFRCISNRLEILSGSARFDGSGTLEPSTLTIGPSGRLDGSTPVVVRGPLVLQAATLAGQGTIVARDGLTFGGGGLTLSGRTLVNQSAARWGGAPAGSLSVAAGGMISNLAGASFELALDAVVADSGGAVGFVNEGLFRKTGGSGNSVFTTAFANRGSVETLAGTLSLAGGGTHRGSFLLGAASRLQFGGNHTLAADSSLSGPGSFAVTSGTATFDGLVDVGGDHVFSGGVANLTGRYNALTNLVAITGGTANFSGTGQVTPSSLVISNLGQLGGTGLLTVRGPTRWSNGRIQGSGLLVAEGGLDIFGGGLTLSGRTLVNRAAARWGGAPAGSLSVAAGGMISNLVGASFELALDAVVADSGGAVGFVNEGLFRKTGGSGNSVFTTTFANRGSVETLAGTLSLAGGGTHRGSFLLGAASRLQFGGNHTLTADSSLSGPGSFAVTSGTATFDGLVDVGGDHVFSGGVANLTGRYNALTNLVAITGGTANFSGTGQVTPSSLVISNLGQLGGTGLLTVRGPTRWSNGRIQGSGLLVAEGGLEMIGGGLTLSGRTLVNRAAARWGGAPAGSLSVAAGGMISNLVGASFELALDAVVADSGGAVGFVNEGLFRKTGGSGNSVFTTAFRNSGRMELLAGTLRLQSGLTQTAGNLVLRGGALASSTPVRILGGRLSGSGTVIAGITNAGWIQPGDAPGRMVLGGDYAQNEAGSCEVRLAGYQPGAGHDQLVISNTASLGGILVVDLTEGFEPTPAAGFEILQANRRSGTFATFQYPSNIVGLALEYTISNVVVRVVNTRPVIDPIPDQTVDATGSLTVAIAARDADVPKQKLRYALTNAPAGATIDQEGIVHWTPSSLPPGFVTNLTVVVTDDGTPNLGTSRGFSVQADAVPRLTAVSLEFGIPAAGANRLTFRGIPGYTYHAEYALRLPGPWFDLATATASGNGIWTVVDADATNAARFYRAR